MAKALIIDEDRDVSETLALVLQNAGHEALTAPNTAAGAMCFEADRPDIVLADISARCSDGLARIRAIQMVDPAARIIAMSADPLADHGAWLQDVKCVGAMAVLPKPFDADELLSIVASCLAATQRLAGS